MRSYIFFILLCAIITAGCSRSKDDPEITVNKNKSGPEKETVSEIKSEENKNSDITSPKIITSKEVKAHIGDSITIKGFVADIYLSDKVAYLNFENKFPKNLFSCAIFSPKFEVFGDLTKYKNKMVEVSGKITTFKGKPQVILNSTDQIKIMTDG